jgi:hypothetical protein
MRVDRGIALSSCVRKYRICGFAVVMICLAAYKRVYAVMGIVVEHVIR